MQLMFGSVLCVVLVSMTTIVTSKNTQFIENYQFYEFITYNSQRATPLVQLFQHLNSINVPNLVANHLNQHTTIDLIDGKNVPATSLATLLATVANHTIGIQCLADFEYFTQSLASYGTVIVNSNCTADDTDCLNQLKMQLDENKWALKVIDSLGKVPPGVFEGNRFWLGDWHECRHISESKGEPPERQSFNGQYCKANMNIGPNVDNTTAKLATVQYGFCVPDTCSADDTYVMLELIRYLIRKSGKEPLITIVEDIDFSDVICYSERHIYNDGLAIAAIVFVSVWGLILIFATAYDILDHQPKLKQLRTRYEEFMTEKERLLKNNADKDYEFGEPPESEADFCKNLSLFTKFVLALSAWSNTKKLVSMERRPGSFDCVHGIRFLSMCWVVLGHTYYYGLSVCDNLGLISEIVSPALYQTIDNATVSVDSFFVISAILLSYLWLKEADKTKGHLRSVKSWFLYYFHRYARLTPAYMIILFLEVALFRYLADGPLWPRNGVDADNCSYWWTNLLYVNNFVDHTKLCMGHTWFLANDMQFHVLAPMILIPLFLFPPIAICFSAVVIIGSALYRGYVVASNEFSPNGAYGINPTFNNVGAMDYFDQVYVKPYMRCGPYVWGLLVGYILYRLRGTTVRIPKIVNFVVWVLSVAICCAVVYGLYHWVSTTDKMPQALNGFYAAVNRTVWSMALSWMIFACVTGNGGIVDKILSWPGFFPASRLTYCAYLLHPMIIQLAYLGRSVPVHFDGHYSMVYYFFAHLIVAYSIAFIFSMAFEATAMNIEKLCLSSLFNLLPQANSTNRAVSPQGGNPQPTTSSMGTSNQQPGGSSNAGEANRSPIQGANGTQNLNVSSADEPVGNRSLNLSNSSGVEIDIEAAVSSEDSISRSSSVYNERSQPMSGSRNVPLDGYYSNSRSELHNRRF